jgi:hypothetical protein
MNELYESSMADSSIFQNVQLSDLPPNTCGIKCDQAGIDGDESSDVDEGPEAKKQRVAPTITACVVRIIGKLCVRDITCLMHEKYVYMFIYTFTNIIIYKYNDFSYDTSNNCFQEI